MNKPLRLMAILAHPDDESLAIGATLAKYANAGVEIYLLTATRGERGWLGPPVEYPGPTALGDLREQELHSAVEVLGLREVHFLGYADGELDKADPVEAIGRIVQHIRRIRPHVVVTFDPYGVYGHPDHIAISQLTTSAVLAAASVQHERTDVPHQVSKLYYIVGTAERLAHYQDVFGDLVMEIDKVERRVCSWPSWAVTTRVDAADYWRQAWQAIAYHRSQLPTYHKLQELSEAQQRSLWSTQTFYRALSMVNGGRAMEQDLFAGLQ